MGSKGLSGASRKVNGALGVATAVIHDQGFLPAPVHPTSSPAGISVGAEAAGRQEPRGGDSLRGRKDLTFEIWSRRDRPRPARTRRCPAVRTARAPVSSTRERHRPRGQRRLTTRGRRLAARQSPRRGTTRGGHPDQRQSQSPAGSHRAATAAAANPARRSSI